MKFLLLIILVFFSVSIKADPLNVIKVIDQENQLVLIETSSPYDIVEVRIEGETCKGSVKEKVGKHTVVKIQTKTLSSEPNKSVTKCEVKSLLNSEAFSLKTNSESQNNNRYRFYFGGGLSFGKEYKSTPGAKVDNTQFNYAIALYKQSGDLLVGGIYQVYSNRLYGTVPAPTIQSPNKTKSYEIQGNNYLLGLSLRKLYGDIDKSVPYLRLDAGYSWSNIGEGIIGSPRSEVLDSGVGANLGAGILINTGAGAIDLGLFHSLRTSKESSESGGFTNLVLGYCF